MREEQAFDRLPLPLQLVDGARLLAVFVDRQDETAIEKLFIDLNGGADFYAADVQSLLREGETSLRVFLDMCREDGVEPRKSYSGKLMVRLPVELHERAAVAAASHGKSLNAWFAEAVEQAAH